MLKKVKVFSLFLILIGISINIYLIIDSYNTKKEDILEIRNYELLSKTKIENNYFGLLEIPKIDLQKVIYPKNSKENNIDNTVELLKDDDIYNEHSIILVSHSGSTPKSYFKNLKKLLIDDTFYFRTSKNVFIYQIYNVYEAEKNKVYIDRKSETNTISLITCIPYTNKQLVVIGKLIKKL